MINRIQSVLKSKNLSPSLFADAIGVQRSGVSHILSERNRPSLDFVMKVLKTYPEIDADWLLFGKGSMIQKAAESNSEDPEKLPEVKKVEKIENPHPGEKAIIHSLPPSINEIQNKSEIARVVILYADGTFSEYIPRG